MLCGFYDIHKKYSETNDVFTVPAPPMKSCSICHRKTIEYSNLIKSGKRLFCLSCYQNRMLCKYTQLYSCTIDSDTHKYYMTAKGKFSHVCLHYQNSMWHETIKNVDFDEIVSLYKNHKHDKTEYILRMDMSYIKPRLDCNGNVILDHGVYSSGFAAGGEASFNCGSMNDILRNKFSYYREALIDISKYFSPLEADYNRFMYEIWNYLSTQTFMYAMEKSGGNKKLFINILAG